MFSYRNPYSGYTANPHYLTPNDYYGGYGGYPVSLYALAQAEQAQRARQLVLEREEAERRRAAAIRRQRASQYLPEALLRSRGYDTRGRHFPERASRYLPDEYEEEDDQDADMDSDAYDYGLGRSGYHPESYWDQLRQRQRRPSSVTQNHQAQARDFDGQHQHQRQPSKTRQPSQTRQRNVSQHRRSPSPGVCHSIPISGPSSQRQPQAEIRRTSPPPDSSPRREQSQPSSTPTPARSSPTTPSHSLPAPTQYSASPEILDEAATKIQVAYRIHRSLKTIKTLYDKFLTSQKSFVFPEKLDFQVGPDHEHVVSVPITSTPTTEQALSALKAQGFEIPTIQRCQLTPKLAFTHANAVLHAYTESLNRLLMSLDGVESFGEKKVRERRKAVVKSVEQEASKIEGMWRSAWEKWVQILIAPTEGLTSGTAEGEEGEVPAEDVKKDVSSDAVAGEEEEALMEDVEREDGVQESSSGSTPLNALSASEPAIAEAREEPMEDVEKENGVHEYSYGSTPLNALSAFEPVTVEEREEPMEREEVGLHQEAVIYYGATEHQ